MYSGWSDSKSASRSGTQHDVLIVGAGVGGLSMGIALKEKLGVENFVIYEREADVGGTWRVNTYPGCASDIWVHWYSMSSDLNPDWSHSFATQPELEKYLLNVASRHSLRSKCIFNTSVVAAEWDPAMNHYLVVTENVQTGERSYTTAKIFVSAIGILCEPFVPRIEGIDRFKGALFHSARWRHDVDLRGKRVAVIGNGCSAAQIVPVISEDPSTEVVNFCRTRMWYLRRPGQGPYSTITKWAFANIPLIMKMHRFWVYLSYDVQAVITQQSIVSKYLARKMSSHVRATAPPEYHDNLIPDYVPGCKRLVLDAGYLASLHRPNNSMNWDGIERFTEDGIITKKGEHLPFDVIVLATGFITDKFALQLRGRNRQTVEEYYASQGGPTAYMGTTVPGFPNLVLLSGPNTTTGHNSVIFSEEIQIKYALQLIQPILSGSLSSFEVTSDATESYNDLLQSRLQNSVWTQCDSWYRAGTQGKIFSTFPGPLAVYWWWLRRPRWNDYLFEGTGKKNWERNRKVEEAVGWVVKTVVCVGMVGCLGVMMGQTAFGAQIVDWSKSHLLPIVRTAQSEAGRLLSL